MENKSFQLYNEPILKQPLLYEQVLNALPGMILVTDKNDRIIYANENLGKVIDKSLAKDNISMKEIINRADWDNWNENLFRLSNMNNTANCIFTIRLNNNHNPRYVKLEGKILDRDDNLKPLSYFFTGEDVTAECKNEKDSIQTESGDNFKDVKTPIEKELELTVKDLGRSNKDLEQFAYIASHDLQEPLRKITAFASRLAFKFGEKLGEDGKIYLDKINAAADGMKDLIEDLLQLSRADHHSQPFISIDLNETVEQVLQNLDLKIEELNVQIFCERLPVIEGLPFQMKQLFGNLLSNAIKFSAKKKPPVVNITSTEILPEDRMNFELSAGKDYYKITVQDNGIGFSQECAQHIFKIFYRLNSKAEYPGNGIGLAICSKIVEKHNGIISAQSEPGKGTAFIIILPKTQG